METINDNLVKEINHLITLNNDRIEGYELASKETNDLGLKNLFDQLSKNSRDFVTELSAEVGKMGGEPATGTSTTGKFYRAWMEIKTALTGADRKAILNSCEYGEDVILEAYENSMASDVEIPADTRQILTVHLAELEESHDTIKFLRDSLVVA